MSYSFSIKDMFKLLFLKGTCLTQTVGAASQWWSNERMMVYFKLHKASKMLFNDGLARQWWWNECIMLIYSFHHHWRAKPSITSFSPSLTSIIETLKVCVWRNRPFGDFKMIVIFWTPTQKYPHFITDITSANVNHIAFEIGSGSSGGYISP